MFIILDRHLPWRAKRKSILLEVMNHNELVYPDVRWSCSSINVKFNSLFLFVFWVNDGIKQNTTWEVFEYK